MDQQQRVFLMILDGWGIGKKDFTDGIYNAKTPFINQLYSKVPNTTLTTFGNAVGLPEGQMGNSEVGHMNIGAGRVVWQQLALINKQFDEGTAQDLPAMQALMDYCLQQQQPLHLIGLVSDGGVHSSLDHVIKLCQIAQNKGLKQVYIHVFTDGRDTDPRSGVQYIEQLEQAIQNGPAKIASVIGRYYAMDRDKRWERVKLAYELIVNGVGTPYASAHAAISDQYQKQTTDEFLLPSVIVDEQQQPIAKIAQGNAVLCFNFRTDRGRQITQALTQEAFVEQGMQPLELYYATMTEYDERYQNVKVLFPSQNIKMTLGEVLSLHHKKQLRSAETEKYPHVTFFFSGGQEACFEGEDRIMEPSPKVATYDLQPEMSALPLTQKILAALVQNQYDFICLNFANTDMVGHTGVWEAIIKAAETVDACVEQLYQKALSMGYQMVIIADHGNSDEAKNPDGSPNTAHSMNPVPCFIVSPACKQLNQAGKLADVAPTILKMMNLPIPSEMDGNCLF